MLRNRKNKFSPISKTCVFIELVAFDFDCTTYLHKIFALLCSSMHCTLSLIDPK